jgi:ribosomal protein S12 methylthiotransferase
MSDNPPLAKKRIELYNIYFWRYILNLAVRVGLISLGCTKNLVDSEVMLGLLAKEGYEITPDEDKADILIVNTCAFIESARRESMDTIAQLIKANEGDRKKIIVTGCLAQRYERQLIDKFAGKIQAVLGAADFHHISGACKAVLDGGSGYTQVSKEPLYIYDHKTPRLRATMPHTAYVKIAEGCDNCCSYCVIPRIRGRYRSRPIDSIVAEATSLAGAGVKEINLIAQDTTYYGRDLADADLPSLLRELVKIPNIHWIRILYGHPAHIGDDLLKLIANEEKICSYMDVPIQHIHDDILRGMGRQTTQSQIYHLIDKIRGIIQDVTLRTSLIVGYPGESEKHFNSLMRFVSQIQFDHLGVFTYSHEEGTKAGNISSQVPESIKEERLDRIAQLHEKLAGKKRRSLIGQRKSVLVDIDGEQAIGRTQGQAPDIDDVVYITHGNVRSGEFIEVEIIDTYGTYDLIGRML